MTRLLNQKLRWVRCAAPRLRFRPSSAVPHTRTRPRDRLSPTGRDFSNICCTNALATAWTRAGLHVKSHAYPAVMHLHRSFLYVVEGMRVCNELSRCLSWQCLRCDFSAASVLHTAVQLRNVHFQRDLEMGRAGVTAWFTVTCWPLCVNVCVAPH